MDKNEENNNTTREVSMDGTVLSAAAAAVPAPATAIAIAIPAPGADGATVFQPVDAGTFVVLKWHNAFVCFEGVLLNEFLYPSLNHCAMPVTDTRFVIWNDRQSVCRLIPFSALRKACRRPTPDTAFLSHKNKATLIWDLAATIFPKHIDEWKGRNYRMVGALDSHSPASNAIERCLITKHRLSVPMDMFQTALREVLRTARASEGAKAEESAKSESPHHGAAGPVPAGEQQPHQHQPSHAAHCSSSSSAGKCGQ